MSLLSESVASCLSSEQKESSPASDEDFQNCKGQCGYTQWCRACMEEKNKLIREAEQKERYDADKRYD